MRECRLDAERDLLENKVFEDEKTRSSNVSVREVEEEN